MSHDQRSGWAYSGLFGEDARANFLKFNIVRLSHVPRFNILRINTTQNQIFRQLYLVSYAAYRNNLGDLNLYLNLNTETSSGPTGLQERFYWWRTEPYRNPVQPPRPHWIFQEAYPAGNLNGIPFTVFKAFPGLLPDANLTRIRVRYCARRSNGTIFDYVNNELTITPQPA